MVMTQVVGRNQLKPLQNKKGQKNVGYPRKKQSFYLEKDCFFLGYPTFFGPSYFEVALPKSEFTTLMLFSSEFLKGFF